MLLLSLLLIFEVGWDCKFSSFLDIEWMLFFKDGFVVGVWIGRDLLLYKFDWFDFNFLRCEIE